MSEVYNQEFHIRWADLDPNGHMRHTAYGDLCAATRFAYLESLGFTMKKFSELKIGPVIFNENVHYLSEILPGDKARVNIRVKGLSEDGRKWKMLHEIYRLSDGKLSATLEISGAWFDLLKRKVTFPPNILQEKIKSIPRTEDFEVL